MVLTAPCGMRIKIPLDLDELGTQVWEDLGIARLNLQHQ